MCEIDPPLTISFKCCFNRRPCDSCLFLNYVNIIARTVLAIHCIAAALHVKNGTPEIFRTALPTIHMENTDQLHLGLWLIEADGRWQASTCRQMFVEYDQVRFAAMEIKLHAMLLLCMLGTKHTCAFIHVHQLI